MTSWCLSSNLIADICVWYFLIDPFPQVLLEIFNQSGPVKGAAYPNEAFLGIHDLYKEGEWVTLLGDSLARTGYTRWSDKWGGQPDNGGGKQHCGALMKEGGMDDVACDVPFPFFCELPLMHALHWKRKSLGGTGQGLSIVRIRFTRRCHVQRCIATLL